MNRVATRLLRLAAWGLLGVAGTRWVFFAVREVPRPRPGLVALYTAARLVREGVGVERFYDDAWFQAQVRRVTPIYASRPAHPHTGRLCPPETDKVDGRRLGRRRPPDRSAPSLSVPGPGRRALGAPGLSQAIRRLAPVGPGDRDGRSSHPSRTALRRIKAAFQPLACGVRSSGPRVGRSGAYARTPNPDFPALPLTYPSRAAARRRRSMMARPRPTSGTGSA